MKNLVNIYPKLNQRLITNKDLEIEPRVFHHWRESGVIDYNKNTESEDIPNKERRGKVFFNAYETLWLLMVKDLRELNIDLKTIIQIKEFLFADQVNSSELTPEFIKELSDNGVMDTILKSLPEEVRNEIASDKMKLSQFVSMMQSMSKNIVDMQPNWLTTFYTTILLMNKTPVLQLIKKGTTIDINIIVIEDFYPHSTKLESMQEVVKNLTNDFYINIPICKYFDRILTDFKLDVLAIKFELFSKLELEVLEKIKDGDFQEIKIYDNSEKDYTVTVIKKDDLFGEKVRELKKIFGLKAYDKLELIFRNEKHIVLKNEIRNKVEK